MTGQCGDTEAQVCECLYYQQVLSGLIAPNRTKKPTHTPLSISLAIKEAIPPFESIKFSNGKMLENETHKYIVAELGSGLPSGCSESERQRLVLYEIS